MNPTLRRLLLGSAADRFQRSLDLLLALALFVVTFAAYALGFFAVAGGVVVVPGDAAIVGLLAAGLVGYQRSGLVVAWLVAYAPLLGYRADRAFLGPSSRSFAEGFAYFVEPDGLASLGSIAIALGTLAFAAGVLANRIVEFVRSDAATGPARRRGR